MSSSPLSRNGIKLARPSPETTRSAVVFDCVVTAKLSITCCRHVALKGPHEIAQGEALGHAAKHGMSPERAKYGSVQRVELTGREFLCAMPPFQGGNRVGVAFPGLRPGRPKASLWALIRPLRGRLWNACLNAIGRAPRRGSLFLDLIRVDEWPPASRLDCP